MKSAPFGFACVLAAFGLSAHAVQPTVRCNSSMADFVVLSGVSAPAAERISAVVKDRKADPTLYEALWAPQAAAPGPGSFLYLYLDGAQDMDEIAAAMRTNPVVAALGVTKIQSWRDIQLEEASRGLVPGLPSPITKIATEYYDTINDHYYWANAFGEDAFIDAGGAGPGWIRTGERMVVDEAGWVNRYSDPVWEFFRKANGSHFLTRDPVECGILRRDEAVGGWKLVNRPFGVLPGYVPPGRDCPEGQVPLYRLYNGRDASPAHRYTTKASIRDQMQAQGWKYEKIAMCVVPAP